MQQAKFWWDVPSWSKGYKGKRLRKVALLKWNNSALMAISQLCFGMYNIQYITLQLYS
jgi:hypothetical protein